jgi:phosphoglycolate phosphatase-like HAD superfamily hydrolase
VEIWEHYRELGYQKEEDIDYKELFPEIPSYLKKLPKKSSEFHFKVGHTVDELVQAVERFETQ